RQQGNPGPREHQMRCVNDHLLIQHRNSSWWHDQSSGDAATWCPSIPACGHENITEEPHGDARCPSGTIIFAYCADCGIQVRTYPLPLLIGPAGDR
ncbi:MAG: hypothetical protein ACRD0H_24045, partial [Actinomycetes bacterium]